MPRPAPTNDGYPAYDQCSVHVSRSSQAIVCKGMQVCWPGQFIFELALVHGSDGAGRDAT